MNTFSNPAMLDGKQIISYSPIIYAYYRVSNDTPVYVGQTIQLLSYRDRQHSANFKTRFDKIYVRDEHKFELKILEQIEFKGNVLPYSEEEESLLTSIAKWNNDKECVYIKKVTTNVSGFNKMKGGGCLVESLRYGLYGKDAHFDVVYRSLQRYKALNRYLCSIPKDFIVPATEDWEKEMW